MALFSPSSVAGAGSEGIGAERVVAIRNTPMMNMDFILDQILNISDYM